MSAKVEFRCNFCGEVQVQASDMWCRARLLNGKPINNLLIDKEWTADPMHNIDGPHICENCAFSLAEKYAGHILRERCPNYEFDD